MGETGLFVQLIKYAAVGASSSAISLGSYFLLTRFCSFPFVPATIAGWFLANFYAFELSSIYVFSGSGFAHFTKSMFVWNRARIQAFCTFISGRALGFIIETSVLFILIDVAGLDDMPVKLSSSLIWGACMYLFDKKVVFVSRKEALEKLKVFLASATLRNRW